MFTESRSLVRRALRAADAFAAPHGIDRYIEQVVPTWSSTEVRGRVVAVDRSAAGSVVLRIRPNGCWTGFEPGQYTQLTVEIDGVRHTRCYSMASSATEAGTFELGIRAHQHGLVSRHLLHHAAVGDIVGLTPARGDFHLPARRPERIVLVSGGSGITPVLAMARTLVAEGYPGRVTFLHYARSAGEQMFATELAALARHDRLDVVTVHDDDPTAAPVSGLFSVEHLDAVAPDWRDAEVFVCGPAPLMDAVRAVADVAGRGDHVHHEAFTLPHLLGEAVGSGGLVRFAVSGVDVDTATGTGGADSSGTLLEVAENAGLSPENGCRMGICHTCTSRLCDGSVQNVVTGEVTSASAASPVEIRVCVSAPIGDVVVDL